MLTYLLIAHIAEKPLFKEHFLPLINRLLYDPFARKTKKIFFVAGETKARLWR